MPTNPGEVGGGGDRQLQLQPRIRHVWTQDKVFSRKSKKHCQRLNGCYSWVLLQTWVSKQLEQGYSKLWPKNSILSPNCTNAVVRVSGIAVAWQRRWKEMHCERGNRIKFRRAGGLERERLPLPISLIPLLGLLSLFLGLWVPEWGAMPQEKIILSWFIEDESLAIPNYLRE